MYITYLVNDTRMLFGGMRVVFEHVNRLQEQGHKVEVWDRVASGTPSFTCQVAIKKYQKRKLNDPDVVVITNPGFMGDVAAHRTKPPTIYLMQHDYDWMSQFVGTGLTGIPAEYLDRFSRGEWLIIAVSKWIQGVIKERYGLSSTVVRNSIDHKVFHPRKPIITMDKPIVLLYYDPQSWKGFSEALFATRLVKEQIIDLEIVIFGRWFPDEDPTAERYVGLNFPAMFFNTPTQSNLARLYASATVYVNTPWMEGFGLTGLEALACGAALVTTDAGGNREYALDGHTAVIVPPRDPIGIGTGIASILQDNQLRAQISHEGIAKAKEFNWQDSILTLERVFKEL